MAASPKKASSESTHITFTSIEGSIYTAPRASTMLAQETGGRPYVQILSRTSVFFIDPKEYQRLLEELS